MRQRFWQLTAILAVLSAAYVVATTFAGIARHREVLPYLDHWATVDDARRLADGEYDLAWLFRQHNEHCIAVPRLLYLVDSLAFGHSGAFLHAATLLIQALHAGLLLWLVRLAGMRDRWKCIATGGVFATCTFSAAQFTNLVEPFQVQFVLVYLAATSAFAALLRAAATERRTLWIAAAAAAACVGSLTMANGLLIWLLLALLAACLRLGPSVVVGFAVVFGLALVCYRIGYVTPPGHTSPMDSLARPLEVAEYALCLIGGALRLADAVPHTLPSLLAGIAGAAAFALLGLSVWRAGANVQDSADPDVGDGGDAGVPAVLHRGVQLAAAATGAFALGSAALIALGRLDFGLQSSLAERYGTISLLFLAALIVAGLAARKRGSRAAAAVFALLLAVVLVAQQGPRIDGGGWRHAATQRAELACLVGVCDAEAMEPMIRREPEIVAQVFDRSLPFLRGRELSIFRTTRDDVLGRPLAEVLGLIDVTACAGAIERLDYVAGTGWGFFATGRAWIPAAAQRPTRGLFVDATDRIVGLCDVEAGDGPPDARGVEVRFLGYAIAQRPDSEVRALLGVGGEVRFGVAGTATCKGSELATGAGRPIAGITVTVDGRFLPRGEDAEASAVPDTHTGTRVSVSLEAGVVIQQPIVGEGVIGVPLATGPNSFGVGALLLDQSTGRIVRTLRPPPTFGEWRVWSVPIPKELAGRRLTVTAGDLGKNVGQWLAVATPTWLSPHPR